MTFTSGSTLTAAQMNTYVRDNSNETAAAKASNAGFHFVTVSANSIAERGIVADTVATAQTTTSTSYTNLATTGPRVQNITTGTQAIVSITSRLSNNGTNESMSAFAVTGATTTPADDTTNIQILGSAGDRVRCSGVFWVGLTAGSNTFTQQYRVVGGTGTYADRHMIVIGL